MCLMTLNENQTIKTKFQMYSVFGSVMCPVTLNESPLEFQKAYL